MQPWGIEMRLFAHQIFFSKRGEEQKTALFDMSRGTFHLFVGHNTVSPEEPSSPQVSVLLCFGKI